MTPWLELLYPSCKGCRKFLIPGERFSNGYTDSKNFCHACAAAADRYHEEEFSAGLD